MELENSTGERIRGEREPGRTFLVPFLPFSFLLLLTFSCIFADVGAQPRASAPADRWAQFRGTPALLGTSDAKLPPTLKLQWTYEAGDAIESSAAIADGTVFVGSQTGDLHA